MLVPLGAALALMAGARMAAAGESKPLEVVAGVLTLALTALTARGLWRWRRWALWLSWAIAAGMLVLGGFGARFVWTFQPFQEPTLWSRAMDVLLNPTVMPFLVCPLIWLAYFTRRGVRAQFGRSSERGFVSVNLGMLVLWLVLYGWTGFYAGARFGHPALGAVLGVAVGLVPSAWLAFGAHYGGWLSFLAIPVVLALGIVPMDSRLWVGVAGCVAPWLIILVWRKS
jgi:hypothetical protein